MPVTTQDLLTCLHRMAEVIEANREYLTALDAAIGDADHGINMDRGFKAALERLPPVEDKDAGTILKTVGVALVSTVGGAGGPLYGTAFMRLERYWRENTNWTPRMCWLPWMRPFRGS